MDDLVPIANREFALQPARAYSSKKNAERAVERRGLSHLRHCYTYTADGRCFPLFMGEAAMQAGAHFSFNVVG